MESHTCTLCDHSYNSSANTPLVLPCSHSFCRDCLNKIVAAGNKLCPYCRASWNNVRLSDLPSCHQLIPDSGTSPRFGGCGDHGGRYIFWCKSCVVPACKKCLSLTHKSCNWTLMEDKEDKLQEQRETIHRSLKLKKTKYSAKLLENETSLASIRPIFQDLRLVEREMLDYQEKVMTWQVEAEEMLANPNYLSESSKPVKSKKNSSTVLEELERRIPPHPSSLLTHIASAYQNSNEDIEEFVSKLRNSVEGSWADEGEEQAPKARTTFKEAVASLTEGEDWVVSDLVSSNALQSVLQTTSVRPNNVQLAYKNITDKKLLQLANFFIDKPYAVEFLEKMDSFLAFEEPAAKMRSITTSKLDLWNRAAGWGKLTQFWGHLDAAALKKLPATIESLGLVLRDQDDMAAVKALCEVALKTSDRYYSYDKKIFKWKGWTDLNLSVAKTFLPDHWELTYKFPCKMDKKYTTLPAILLDNNVRFCIHLPQLVPGDKRWMGDIFRKMGTKGCSAPVSLFLPGARIEPDSLLGALRDSCQRWEVHLPANLPQLVPRETVAKWYKGYGHTVNWDLE